MIGALCVPIALSACAQRPPGKSGKPRSHTLEARVVEVYDGDTVRVRAGRRRETVRLLGVDCPEVAHPPEPAEYFGPEAASFARGLAAGKVVVLSDDALADPRDKYGRLLRYVTLPDGRLLNALLIDEGYCRVIGWFPFERRKEFTRLEAAARDHRLGLWRSHPGDDSVAPPGAQAPLLISWEEARQHYGEQVTVAGRVIEAKNTGKACFLNFHPDWRRTFTAVIFQGDFGRFPLPPEQLFKGEEVRVTGRVREYRGKPEIIIRAPSQIQIVNGD